MLRMLFIFTGKVCADKRITNTFFNQIAYLITEIITYC